MTAMAAVKAVTAGARFRAVMLEAARWFTTDRDSAAAVAVNAGPLLAWAEAAADEDDLRVRGRALLEHHLTAKYAPGCEPPDDNPQRFLAGAKTRYARLRSLRELSQARPEETS